jgi:hypothetical protein
VTLDAATYTLLYTFILKLVKKSRLSDSMCAVSNSIGRGRIGGLADKVNSYYFCWEISPVVHSANWVLLARDRYLRLGLDRYLRG